MRKLMARYSEDSLDENTKRRPGSFKGEYHRNTKSEKRSGSFKGEHHKNTESEKRASSFKGDHHKNTESEKRPGSFKGEHHRNTGGGSHIVHADNRRKWHSGKYRKIKCDSDVAKFAHSSDHKRKSGDNHHIVVEDSTDTQSPLEERFLSHMPCMMIDKEEEWDIGEMRPRVSSMPARSVAQNSFRYKVLNLSPPLQEINIHRVRHFMIDSKGKVISQGEYIR